MTFRTQCQIAKGLVDPAPLVDVVFLLLLFFLLSSPFVLQSGFGVVLPSSAIPNASSFQELVVTITQDKLLFFNNQPITWPKFSEELTVAARLNPRAELIIKADKLTPHGAVVELMNIALQAGLSVVNIATRPEVAAPPAPK